jgi:hypothetical protein
MQEEKSSLPVKQIGTSESLVVHDNSEFATLLDTARFNQTWRVAKLFAASKLVPAHFQNQPESVFVMLQMAFRLQIDPMMTLQNTYMVHGRPAMESKLIIALVNSRGPFTGPIQWRMEGQGSARKCTAYATHKATGAVCEATVTWEMVEAEGWSKKDGSKWKTMPDLMFRYRSAAFLARLYCPEVIMGMATIDELEDIANSQYQPISPPTDITPEPKIATPEYDTALLDKFNDLVAGKNLPEKFCPKLEEFIAATAKANGVTIDNLKSQAAASFDGFWKAFKSWLKKNGEKNGIQDSPQAQPAPPESQTDGNPKVNGKGAIAPITEAQINKVEGLCNGKEEKSHQRGNIGPCRPERHD